MNASAQQAPDPVLEELVAYLDGELPSEQKQQVEQRLSQDEPYRARLQELQAVWDVLDYLPPPEVDEQFTHTTVNMIAMAASREIEQSSSDSAPQNTTRLLLGLAAVAALVVGFVIAAVMFRYPRRRLEQDLPVIENFELYRSVDDFEFLKELEKEPLFHEPQESSDDASE